MDHPTDIHGDVTGAWGAAPPPTPEETGAQAREELRRTAEQQVFPAVRAFAVFLRDPAQTRWITGKKDDRTTTIDQGARVTYAFPPGTTQMLFGHLEALRREGLAANFSERQGTPESPTAGLMLDFDLTVGDPKARLQDRHAHRIVSRIVRSLQRDLVFPAAAAPQREVSLHVFTTVKPAAVAIDETRYRYGFHVLVPGVRVTRGYKKYLLRRLRQDGGIATALADLGVQGDLHECLDANSASVPVLFLGSCKRGGGPYRLGPAFAVTFDVAVRDSQGGVSARPDDEDSLMIQAVNPEALEREGYNLVAELSVCHVAAYGAERPPLVPAWECSHRPELAPEIEDLARRTQNGLVGADELLFTEHALSTLAVHDPEARYLHQVLDLLDESYYTDRNKWRDVIYALANTSDTYKPLAEWFSHKCPAKWVDGGRAALDQLWDDAVARRGAVAAPLTQRSLIRWAQLCNPERFRQVSEQNYFTILAKFVYEHLGVLEHYMVAKVLHVMLSNKFVVDVDDGHRGRYTYCWFEFVVPGQTARPGEVWKWRKEVEPVELHVYLSENLVKVFDQVALHIDEQRAAAVDEETAKYYQKLGATFRMTRRKIFNDTFKNGVLRQATYLFLRRGFVETLDQAPQLLGTANGILQLGPTCVLIDHFHEHPIMRYTPVPYRPFDPCSPWTRLMLGAFADIIPEPDVRDWILFFAASSLAGGVKEGIILLWNGGGANGKTFVMRMIAKALGKQYARKLNIALLTSERESADKPNSAIMQLKGCRYGYVEETQKSEPLNTQRLKEIVNPGDISGRDLHKTQENFEVTANLMVGQNYNFDVRGMADHGTWRRIVHYTAKVKFCAHPDPANPFEKQDDQRFVQVHVNDPACQEAMLSILAHYYERLQREHGGLVKNVPRPTLDRETLAFRNSQDTINRFITESIVLTRGGNHEYPLDIVSNHYMEWYNANIDRRKHVPSEIIQDFENSVLQKYLKRAPNGTMVLHDCRILTPDSRGLAAGEAYMVGLAAGEPSAASAPPPASRVNWWDPPATQTRPPLEPSTLLDDDSDFLEPLGGVAPQRRPRRAAAARPPARAGVEALTPADAQAPPPADAELEDLLAQMFSEKNDQTRVTGGGPK
jgi:phage/plasmid-associated DNA primase